VGVENRKKHPMTSPGRYFTVKWDKINYYSNSKGLGFADCLAIDELFEGTGVNEQRIFFPNTISKSNCGQVDS
ncbi:MAG: hypothetical protein PVG14_14860, partial [Anaerolineales bacterium]